MASAVKCPTIEQSKCPPFFLTDTLEQHRLPLHPSLCAARLMKGSLVSGCSASRVTVESQSSVSFSSERVNKPISWGWGVKFAKSLYFRCALLGFATIAFAAVPPAAQAQAVAATLSG